MQLVVKLPGYSIVFSASACRPLCPYSGKIFCMQPCTGVYSWKDGHRLSLRETGWRGSALVSVNAKRMNRARRFARRWSLVVEVECGISWSSMSWWWFSPYKYSAPHMNDINEASFLILLTTRQFTSFGRLQYSLLRSITMPYADMQADADNINHLPLMLMHIQSALRLLLRKILYYELPAASFHISPCSGCWVVWRTVTHQKGPSNNERLKIKTEYFVIIICYICIIKCFSKTYLPSSLLLTSIVLPSSPWWKVVLYVSRIIRLSRYCFLSPLPPLSHSTRERRRVRNRKHLL